MNTSSHIPAVLRNPDQENGLFTHCRICDRDLTAPDAEYLVEKMVRNDSQEWGPQELFAFAICLPCAQNIQGRMSEDSRRALEEFSEKHLKRLARTPGWSPQQSLEEHSCFFSGKPLGEEEAYQVTGLFRGKELQSHRPVMLVGSTVIEEMQENLSQATRDEMDRFTGDNFGWPPEVREALQGKRLLLI